MKNNEKRESHQEETPDQPTVEEQFLITEYTTLNNIIKTINDRILSYTKIVMSGVVSIFVYGIGGFLYKQKLGESPELHSTYGIVGIILTIGALFLIVVLFRMAASSRRHRIRYWKAIHSIRGYMKTKNPTISRFLILPGEVSSRENRPNISGASFDAYAIGYVGFSILFLLFSGYFANSAISGIAEMTKCGSIKELISANTTKIAFFSIVSISVFLFLPKQIIIIRQRFLSAGHCQPNNAFYEFPEGVRPSHHNKLATLVYLINILLISYVSLVRPLLSHYSSRSSYIPDIFQPPMSATESYVLIGLTAAINIIAIILAITYYRCKVKTAVEKHKEEDPNCQLCPRWVAKVPSQS